jgi:hypothetical protein
MANIEASQPDVSLYDVAEHIVGYRSEDICEEEWDGPVFDRPTIEAWALALKELIAAVRDGRLKVRGRRSGSNHSEELQPDAFEDLKVCNPFADFDFGIELSGKDVLEFDEDGRAKIVKSASDFGGRSEVIWTHLFAVSGGEVLKLWPSETRKGLAEKTAADAELLLEAYRPTENRLDDVEAASVEIGAPPPNLARRLANELSKKYRGGKPAMTNPQILKSLGTPASLRTLNRALETLGWSSPRGKPNAK